ncbi:MAG: hypothetical protein A2152_02680 [Candidatus Levybacteria bacterium RBG_16_35_6]|nr:MAG: hypothetical protein A2152_02680 [Candidatus Levybacteria bacterium RBG_16_35_6]
MEADQKPGAEGAAFVSQEQRILSNIAGSSGFSFREGDCWSINPDTGDTTYDTKFFTEKGYTPSQALFGALHEIKCHLVEIAELIDTPEGARAYEKLKQRIKSKERVKIWENCRTDVKGNLAILGFAPSLSNDVETVYREKLWPETNLTDKPKHLQLMYAILRSSMVPSEDIIVDPVVQETIDKLKNIKGKDGKVRDVIAMATDPTLDPFLALKLSERYIEPEIEKLFKEDVEDKQKEEGKKGTGDPQDQFSDDYKDYDERHPEPFNKDEMGKQIKSVKKAQSEASRQAAGYEEEHQVSKEEVSEYYNEYRKIEQYIEPLREIFRKIIEQRQIKVRHLAALKEEGVMIDPGLVAQTYMDVKAGIANPKTIKDFEGILVDEKIPTSFEVTVVADRTGSMQYGTKIPEQRRTTLLLLEALKEFSDVAEEQGPLAPELTIKSEILSFGDSPNHTEVLKPLSHVLSERDRIGVFKALGICDSGTNNEEIMFANLLTSIQQEGQKDTTYLERIRIGKLRKFVIILTDGQVGNFGATRTQLQKLRDMGIVVAGVGITNDGEDAVRTYAPDGKVAREASDLPKTLQELLTKYLDTLSIEEKQADMQT